jgi:hypothetical protein
MTRLQSDMCGVWGGRVAELPMLADSRRLEIENYAHQLAPDGTVLLFRALALVVYH